MKKSTNYQPVSCQMHSELELAIMQNKQLKVHFNSENKTRELTIKVHDLITRKGEGEFLLASDKSGKPLEIRLDTIQTFSIL